jgi:hypothetical protein
MKLLNQTRVRFVPVSENDRQLVRMELAEVLRSVHFTHSKRYPALLTHVVEKTLDGQAGDLKERTVGVEVFHRRPDYDNNDDTIVRVTAGEVRKRLALVYHESATGHSVQIELPPGSYVPEFFRDAVEDAPRTGFAPDPPQIVPEPLPVSASLPRAPANTRRFAWAAVALVATGLLGYGLHWSLVQRDSVHRFWQPVRASAVPVILCPGALVFSATSESNVTKAQKTDAYPYISVATADALSSLVDRMARDHIDYSIQPTSAITLTDMREHPMVLVGAYNNEWSLRLLNGLRYRFSDEPNLQIYDSMNPSVVWARPPQVAYKEADDFALVARFRDKLTENFVVIVGGIGKNGTEAAAQFVTSPRYLDLLDRPQSKDWASKNLEFVIRTKVIDGRAVPPTIEAVYLW